MKQITEIIEGRYVYILGSTHERSASNRPWRIHVDDTILVFERWDPDTRSWEELGSMP